MNNNPLATLRAVVLFVKTQVVEVITVEEVLGVPMAVMMEVLVAGE